MKKPKLSMILPIYNKGPLLNDCLKSLISQDVSLNDYEIICVSDGSTDNSENIVREFARNFSNIILICKNRGGSATLEILV